MNKQVYIGREIFIVDGARTPFLKARSKPGPFAASDLAVATAKQLLARQNFDPSEFDEVITGAAMPSEDEANISRIISLRLGCGKKVPAYTVMRNCASGMQALDDAAQHIASGRSDLVLAGGVEAMSHAPLRYNRAAVNWFATLNNAQSFSQKTQAFLKLRPQLFFAPIISILRGLRDPIIGLSMGQTAENLAYQFNITRTEMDQFAAESQRKLTKAQSGKIFSEITPIFDNCGNYYDHDDGVRPNTTIETLAKLRPFFDKKYGNVTAGNSSQITDGAAYLILASKDAVKKYGLSVIGKIVDCHWAGLDPSVMGLGPVFATTPLLQRNNMKLSDVDYWEINEAFSAQVIACLRAWNDTDFCRNHLGLDEKLGEIDSKTLNINGGAIGIGHPIGASGARLVLQLVNILQSKQAKKGIASLCIGGGQGGAMYIEACDSIKN